MNIREFVATLNWDDLIELIRDQELFEKQGCIGDCLLRNKTQEFLDRIFKGENEVAGSITNWMHMMIFDVYRRIAYEHLEKINNTAEVPEK